MVTRIRSGPARVASSDPAQPPTAPPSSEDRRPEEPSVTIDRGPRVPSYLQRDAAAATVATAPTTCVEASERSRVELEAARQAAETELRALEGPMLDAVEQQLRLAQHETRGCTRDAQVRVSLPNGGAQVVAAAAIEGLLRAVHEQRGWSTVLEAIRSAPPAQLSQIAAALQRAAQSQNASGTSVEVQLPRGSRVVVQATDLRVLSRVCDAQARLQRAQHEQSEIEASNLRGEMWRAGASTTMVAGTALAIGECATGTTITGRPMSRTECVFALLGAAASWAGPAYQFTARVMRTEALALATLNANVRLRDVVRAVGRLTEADRQALREIYQAMQGSRPGELVELTAQQEQRAREILQRAGLSSDGPMGALEAGRRYDQLAARNDARMMLTEYRAPEPLDGEAARTDWSIRRNVPHNEQSAADRARAQAGEIVEQRLGIGEGAHEVRTGHIVVSPHGTFTTRMRVLFHERVHRLFHVRVEGSRLQRAFANGANNVHDALRNSSTAAHDVLTYVHEALAESVAQLRLGSADWLGTGLRFPLSGDYQVSVARIGTTVVAGAVAVGVVEVDGTRAQVIIEPRDHALESTVTQYPSELGAITRRRDSEDDVQRAIRNRTTETSR